MLTGSMCKILLNWFILAMVVFHTESDSKFLKDYPQYKLCVVQDYHTLHRSSEDSYIHLTKNLGLRNNCTHIYGTLMIYNLGPFRNGTQPDLQFLKSIREISGGLEIYGNSVTEIALPNLKVIRGNTLNKYGLQIYKNYNQTTQQRLKKLDLSGLRVIQNKGIFLDNDLPYLSTHVNWREIVEQPDKVNLTLEEGMSNHMNDSCHKSCDDWPVSGSNESRKYCFGPLKTQCQPRTKCPRNPKFSHLDLPTQWCLFNGQKIDECDKDCSGGCFGRSNKECEVCTNFYKTDRCVSSCDTSTSRHTFGGPIINIKDKLQYKVAGLCTSHCPASLLAQDKNCQYVCDFDHYYKSGNYCLQCPQNDCKKIISGTLTCQMKNLVSDFLPGRTKSLDLETLEKLTNCTTIVGRLKIDARSFGKFGISVADLYKHLSNVREIIGDVSFVFMGLPVSNLTFLHNLQEIRGYSAGEAFSPGLNVFSKDLKFLGLKNLVKVHGIVNMYLPTDSCYDNTIPWTEITLDRFSKPKCNNTCHPLCTKGCWGPSNKLCYKCEYLTAGESCVRRCEDALGYFTDGNKDNQLKCQKCHPMCQSTCNGPTARDCNGVCKFAKEEDKCVPNCSRKYFPKKPSNGSHVNCIRCHSDCYYGEDLTKADFKNGCTGSSNILGQGGCNMCEKTIILSNNATASNPSSNKMKCYKNDSCPYGFFKKENKNKLIHLESSCVPCLPICGQCQSDTNTRNMCFNCKGFWSNDRCVEKCPPDVRNVPYLLQPDSTCPQCHPQCKSTCQLPNNDTSCDSCTNKKLFLDVNKTKFQCVFKCPPGRNYTELDGEDTVCLILEETKIYKQRQNILYIIIGLVIFFVFLLLIMCIVCKWRFNHNRVKAELNALYSNYKEQNLRNIKEETLMRPPNLHRLQTISIKDLAFDMNDKPLGVGAFGKVFRGQWHVEGPGKKYFWLDVVIKVIHNSTTNEFLDEAKIMASVSHRHCLPLIGVCLSLDRPCLISTFAKYGSLEKYLHKYSSRISSYHMLKWAEQIADGMAYLNIRGIIHRDLAARNILVCSRDTVQITDFGLARLIEDSQQQNITIKSGRVPIRWLALETLIHSVYSSATDVWAYGVTLWEIFTFGQRPYEEVETKHIRSFLQEGNRLYQPSICTLEVYMVMVKCWLEDPDQRVTFQEMISIFEKFSLNPRQYICITRENKMEMIKRDSLLPSQTENIGMQPQYIRRSSGSIPGTTTATTLIDDAQNSLGGNNSNYNISGIRTTPRPPAPDPTLIVDEEANQETLPIRKRRKRCMTTSTAAAAINTLSSQMHSSLSKLANMNILSSKSGGSNSNSNSASHANSNGDHHKQSVSSNNSLLSSSLINSSSKDSKQFPYQQTTTDDMNWTSCDSNSALLPPINHMSRQRDSSTSPRNPRIARLKINPSVPAASKSSLANSNQNGYDNHRVFNDKPLSNNNNNNNTFPISQFTSNKTLDGSDSLDSGNFDNGDYLEPTRIQSSGYYNLTPSPTPFNKAAISISADIPPSLMSNAAENDEALIMGDGYLEPFQLTNTATTNPPNQTL